MCRDIVRFTVNRISEKTKGRQSSGSPDKTQTVIESLTSTNRLISRHVVVRGSVWYRQIDPLRAIDDESCHLLPRHKAQLRLTCNCQVLVTDSCLVNENADFDPEAAAKKLHRAMRGLGTDEEALIEVLTSHNNAQIQEVKSVYQAMYGKILEEELDSELRGNFQEVLVSLVTPRDIYLARQLKKATKGLGTDESTLTEILMTRTNDEIEHLKEVYEQEHGDSLEEDVRGDTGGAFGCLLLSQLAAARDESHEIDIGLARDDAEEIHEAGEGQWGTDESVFNSILCRRSFNQLRATFSQYQDVTGSSIEGAIESEMSGDLQEGFLALVKSIQDKSAYYAERLYKSMKGLGTDEDTLMRVVISRSEIDMQDIKERFEAAYGDSLAGFIKGDTRGDLEKVLLALIGE